MFNLYKTKKGKHYISKLAKKKMKYNNNIEYPYIICMYEPRQIANGRKRLHNK